MRVTPSHSAATASPRPVPTASTTLAEEKHALFRSMAAELARIQPMRADFVTHHQTAAGVAPNHRAAPVGSRTEGEWP